MGKVISVRINESLEKIIIRYSKEEKEDQSEVVRKLINNGSIYLAIKKYAKGKFSLGKAAYLANLPLSEFIEIITDLGIRSKIDKDEILEGYENLKKFM